MSQELTVKELRLKLWQMLDDVTTGDISPAQVTAALAISEHLLQTVVIELDCKIKALEHSIDLGDKSVKLFDANVKGAETSG